MSKSPRAYFLIQSETGKKELYAHLKKLELPYYIEVRTGDIRTLAQNKLYHFWVGVISHEMGQLPEEIRVENQHRFLPFTEIKRNGFTFVVTTSTTDLTIEEMSKYLEQIQIYYKTEHNIELPYKYDVPPPPKNDKIC